VYAISSLARARALDDRYADARYAIELLGRPGEFLEQPSAVILFTVAVWKNHLDVLAYQRAATQKVRERHARLTAALLTAPLDAESASHLCLLLESACALEHIESVRSIHERVELLWQRGMVLTHGTSLLVPRILARSSRLLGERLAAERYFRDAVACAQRAELNPELAQTLLDQAVSLAHGSADELQQAGELAARAHGLSAQLSQSARSSAMRLMAACGVGMTETHAPPKSGALNAQETNLLRRIARGRSCAEIARELVLEPARVAQLVDELFAKVEVNGPGLATAYAFACGIVGRATYATPAPMVLMVTDMVNFTGLVQQAGDLQARSVVHAHNRVVRRQLTAHGGREVTHTGDGFIVAFDRATSALACGAAIQHELAEFRSPQSLGPIRVRIGFNAGPVLPEEGRLFGAALIAAVRICSRAQGGQILLSQSVCELLDDAARDRTERLGMYELKGFERQVALYEFRVQT
jgi:class 3 adenylate cyclase